MNRVLGYIIFICVLIQARVVATTPSEDSIPIVLSKANAERYVIATGSTKRLRVEFSATNTTTQLWITGKRQVWDECDTSNAVLVEGTSPADISMSSTNELYLFVSGTSLSGSLFCRDLSWKAHVVVDHGVDVSEIILFSALGVSCVAAAGFISYQYFAGDKRVLASNISIRLKNKLSRRSSNHTLSRAQAAVSESGLLSHEISSKTAPTDRIKPWSKAGRSVAGSFASTTTEGESGFTHAATDSQLEMRERKTFKESARKQKHKPLHSRSSPNLKLLAKPSFRVEDSTANIRGRSSTIDGATGFLNALSKQSKRGFGRNKTHQRLSKSVGSLLMTTGDKDEFPLMRRKDFEVDTESDTGFDNTGSYSNFSSPPSFGVKFEHDLRDGHFTHYKSPHLRARVLDVAAAARNNQVTAVHNRDYSWGSSSTVSSFDNDYDDPTRIAEDTAKLVRGTDVELTEAFIDLEEGETRSEKRTPKPFTARDLLSSLTSRFSMKSNTKSTSSKKSRDKTSVQSSSKPNRLNSSLEKSRKKNRSLEKRRNRSLEKRQNHSLDKQSNKPSEKRKGSKGKKRSESRTSPFTEVLGNARFDSNIHDDLATPRDTAGASTVASEVTRAAADRLSLDIRILQGRDGDSSEFPDFAEDMALSSKPVQMRKALAIIEGYKHFPQVADNSAKGFEPDV